MVQGIGIGLIMVVWMVAGASIFIKIMDHKTGREPNTREANDRKARNYVPTGNYTQDQRWMIYKQQLEHQDKLDGK